MGAEVLKFYLWIISMCGTFVQQSEVTAHTCLHKIPKLNEVVLGVPIGEPHHVIRKRSIDQPLRIKLVYDNSVNLLPSHKRDLIKDDVLPSAVSYWENTLQVRHTASPIKLLRQCETDQVRYKDGDPYPYCVDGCRDETMCGESKVRPKHLEACRIARRNEGHQTIGYAGEGVQDADFILYVSAYSTERCDIGTTVAYAAYCQLEGALDRTLQGLLSHFANASVSKGSWGYQNFYEKQRRIQKGGAKRPVAGYVNLCPHSVSTQPHDIHQMHSTIKHEILHALGFSAGLYAFFRSPDGTPLTPRSPSTGRPVYNETLQLYQWSDKVVKTVSRLEWQVKHGLVEKEVNMIVTPRVLEEVRRHFNCDNLEGAELEDQGVLGTALTHWEKRVFENEVMTGTYTQNPIVSRITLALMEDTGWYRVNYDNAEALRWGNDLGCDFVKKSCLEWMEKKRESGEHIHPYCNRVKREGLRTECTEERDAVALCNLIEYEDELPTQYQHFHELPGVDPENVPRYAGSVVLADFCPYIQEFNWKKGDLVVRGSRCGIHQNNADPEINYTLEKYGNKSACFDHKRPWYLKHCRVVHSVEHWGSGCYQYECSELEGLVIVVAGQRHRCFHEGQHLSIQVITADWLHEGIIICPSCTEVCQKENINCPAEMSPPEKLENRVSPPCSSSNTLISPLLLLSLTILLKLSEDS